MMEDSNKLLNPFDRTYGAGGISGIEGIEEAHTA